MSDGGEDQGADEAFMGQKKAKNQLVSFGKSRLARAALPFSASDMGVVRREMGESRC